MQLLEETEKNRRPELMLIENVGGLFSVNEGWDFYTVLSKMDENGYDAEWDYIDSA